MIIITILNAIKKPLNNLLAELLQPVINSCQRIAESRALVVALAGQNMIRILQPSIKMMKPKKQFSMNLSSDLSRRSESSSSLLTCFVRFSIDSHLTNSCSSSSSSSSSSVSSSTSTLMPSPCQALALASFLSVSLSAASFSKKACCVRCSWNYYYHYCTECEIVVLSDGKLKPPELPSRCFSLEQEPTLRRTRRR